MANKNNFGDSIINLQTDKTQKVNPQVLNYLQSLFNDPEQVSESAPVDYIHKPQLLTQLKPFAIIAVVFALFSAPQLDCLIDKFLKPSSVLPKIGLKTVIFTVVVYLILNMCKV
jgi:hypothetical protein